MDVAAGAGGAAPGAEPVLPRSPAGPDVPLVPAVALRGLAKRYGEAWAVAGVDLDVPAGSFYGLVGRNGAGKTTTLRMLCGLLRPDAGAIWVLGLPVWADPAPVKARIGVLPEDGRLLDRLRGRELLHYTGVLRGMVRPVVEARTEELLATLDLLDAADNLVIDYSHGMRKKIGLAAALLHGPELLVLDEPFEAVDPVSARTIRLVLDRFVAAGRTILFSSHVMATVEALCDRVAILHEGRVVAAGPLAEVTSGRSLEDAFVDAVGMRHLDERALDWLGRLP
ncbi:MAG: ABC transporter ATP-binding protein [Acidimicrobiales bacterium]|nr:ABC transporter ATP-binding protein [Acidimicrobiales bacterium]